MIKRTILIFILIFWFALTATWGALFFLNAKEPWEYIVTTLCVSGVVCLKIAFLYRLKRVSKAL